MPKIEKSFVMRTAGLLMIVQVVSRVLGYARDVVLLNIFGQSYQTDAFNAAFSIPDFLYNALIGGAIASAFIPVFSSYIAKKTEREAWKVASIFTTWTMMLMLIGCVIAFIFTETLLGWLTKFSPAQMYLPVALTRITLLQAIFMSLCGISQGILNSYQHFTWPAMGTLFYNIFIILGGLLLVKPVEALWPGYGVAGFSIGVVIGSIAFLAVQIPSLKKIGYNYHPALDVHNPGLRQLVKLMIPVLIGLSVSQINVFVTQYLATGLEDGVYTALRTANRFMQLPLGVFSTSICMAIFPTMTAQAAVHDYPEMKKSLSLCLRTITFVILPSSVGLIMLREPIIRLLYEFSGEFTAADTQLAAQALLFYCVGLIGYAAVAALLRAFYALQNTVIPVVVSCAAIGVSVLFSFLLVDSMAHCGLALAYSLAGLFQFFSLFIILRKKIGSLDGRHILASALKTLVGCAVMALAVWAADTGCEALFGISTKMSQLVQVVVGVGAGVTVFFLAACLMKMEEVKLIIDIVNRKLKRKRRQSPPQNITE